ncbi:MAG: amino acid adenylation domain-containing protein, partial [bacterium]
MSNKMQNQTFEAKFDLTPMQQGILFHTLYAPGRGLYVEQIGYRLHGRLDVQAFENAWQSVVEHYEILRSSFEWESTAQPQQLIHREVEVAIDERDWREFAPGEQQTLLDELMRSDREKGFNLSEAPLMRLILIRLGEDLYHLLWSSHHIQLDGWSQSLVLNSVFTAYRSLITGKRVEFESSRSFADYVTHLKNPKSVESETFWRERLRGFDEPSTLGIERLSGQALQVDLAHAQVEMKVSTEATAALQLFARRQRLTSYTLAQGAWALLLSRYSGTDDVVFGSTVSTRPLELEGIESTAGLFINTLPVRVRTPGEAPLSAWLKELQLDAVEAREFDCTSLVDIQKCSELAPGQSLFDSILVFENYPSDHSNSSVAPDLRALPAVSHLSRTNYPLVLLVTPGRELLLQIVFDPSRYELQQVERLLGHLVMLLEEMAKASDDKKLAQFSLLGSEERDKILRTWNDTGCDYDQEMCLPQLFERQAAAAPDAVAAVFDEQAISYAELNTRANRLAHHLQTLGVGPGALVGICLERSIEMVVGLLGILKAGGAYVPLDPAFPKERLAFMLQDCRAGVLLTEQTLLEELPKVDAKVVCLDSDSKAISAQSGENIAPVATSEDLAYMIYTSGSTGNPKGVQIEHRALVNFLVSMGREPGLDDTDALLAVTTLSFDIAGLELYLPLIRGARLVIASRETASDGLLLKERIAACGATMMQATPATWRMLIDAGWNGDQRLKVLCGGEALSRELANELLPRCGELWNMYGPTETTIWSTLTRIDSTVDLNSSDRRGRHALSADSPISPISIGRPIANTQIYLLDQNSQLVPVGVSGELCIGGDGLARGYLNQPELTREKFATNPFAEGKRLYHTGDLARYLPDGRIECLGRVDNQVKIRGYRIEIAEIESVLTEHPEVRQCVVGTRDDAAGGKRLIAYFVSRNETLSVTELRAFLKQRLPDYMVPSAFVALEALPLTPNGKINRRALPAPDLSNIRKESFVAPRTGCEEQLAEIWSEVLKLERVSAGDDFFELGGHSLLATQVMSRVLQQFQVQLPLRALFEASTLSGMAERIQAAEISTEPSKPFATKAISRNGQAPLSFGQQSFWFLTQLNSDSALYNIYRAVRIRGPLDADPLEQALDAIVARHEALRTTFVAHEETGVQIIAPAGKANLLRFDLSTLPVSERESAAARILTKQAHIPFDIGAGPLMRAALIVLSHQEHLFLFAMHHAISDDWSMGVFMNELTALYEDFKTGRKPELQPLQLQYADFAIWQRDWLNEEVVAKQLSYWKQQLAGAPRLLEVPTDHPRPAQPTYAGAREEIVLPPDLIEKLTALSRREKATPFMTILAAFQTLLARYTGQQDIVVGSPIAGRSRAETEALIGYFINTLVMRTDLSGDPTFSELLARVRDVALGAYAHQDVPFERLVEELQPERTLTQPPIFQVMLIFQNSPTPHQRLPGLSLVAEQVSGGLAPLDLTLEMRERPDGMHCWFEYKAELFESSTIAAMAHRFKLLLETVCENSNQKLSAIQMLTQDEQQQLLTQFGSGTDEAPRQQCIHEMFEAQVERTPAAVAVIHKREKITYGELNRQANQLANELRGLGVGPETLVGICMERSIEMIVAILGILKAGGAYVPLDPTYPEERLKLMLSDANPSVLLTQEKVLKLLPSHGAKVICLDSNRPNTAECNAENPKRIATANNLAYVIYTSGSTGKPKGVMVEHASLVNYIENAGLEFGVGHGDRVLQFASISFDTSLEEIFTCLTRGAKLVLRTEEMLASIEGFLETCREWAITVIDLPTAFWHELVRAAAENKLELPPSLRLVIIGGEAALTEHLAGWQKHFGAEVRLVNTYGPTEATIVATVWGPQPSTNGNGPLREVPIGRPVRNVKALILDSFAQPVPVGVTGELHIGGQAVARGYMNRPELTAEKFITDPFSKQINARLYKTGDLARLLADGNIEYVGRIDNQVKIRGFRVELGEIEAALNEHPSVGQSVVMAREDFPGDKRIVAYFTNSSSHAISDAIDASQLRHFLSEKLPVFMLPSAFVPLDKLPLTVSGKIDREALPAPNSMERPVESFVPPSTSVEKKLAAIWEATLNERPIGIRDNFFELGGHSLMAVRLFAQIEKMFNRKLPLAILFQAPTIEGLATVLQDESAEPWSSVVAIQPGGRRQPFFCVHAVGGNVLEYHDLARHLGPDQPFYGLQSQGLDGKNAPLNQIDEMATLYIKELRAVQPDGPYMIGGRSFGGVVA